MREGGRGREVPSPNLVFKKTCCIREHLQLILCLFAVCSRSIRGILSSHALWPGSMTARRPNPERERRPPEKGATAGAAAGPGKRKSSGSIMAPMLQLTHKSATFSTVLVFLCLAVVRARPSKSSCCQSLRFPPSRPGAVGQGEWVSGCLVGW